MVPGTSPYPRKSGKRGLESRLKHRIWWQGRVKSLQDTPPIAGAGNDAQNSAIKRGIAPSVKEGRNMAKDGTARGGQRVGSGRKPRPLAERIIEGKELQAEPIGEAEELDAADMPPPKEWMLRDQKNGKPLGAKEIYEEDYRWLRKMGCDRTISPALVQQHAMCVARWIQCENAISEFGFIAKHPTTGAPIASPYVSMSRDFLKQVNQTWYQIAQFVRENSQSVISGPTPQDELMEKLLSGR